MSSASLAELTAGASPRRLESRGSLRALPSTSNLYEGGPLTGAATTTSANAASPRVRQSAHDLLNDGVNASPADHDDNDRGDDDINRGGRATGSRAPSRRLSRGATGASKTHYNSPLKALAEKKPTAFFSREVQDRDGGRRNSEQRRRSGSPSKIGSLNSPNSSLFGSVNVGGAAVAKDGAGDPTLGGVSRASQSWVGASSQQFSTLSPGGGGSSTSSGANAMAAVFNTANYNNSSPIANMFATTSTLFSPRDQSPRPVRGGFSNEVLAMETGCQYLLDHLPDQRAGGSSSSSAMSSLSRQAKHPRGGKEDGLTANAQQMTSEDVFAEANALAARLEELEKAAQQLKHSLLTFDPAPQRTNRRGSQANLGATGSTTDGSGGGFGGADGAGRGKVFARAKEAKLPPLQLKNICPPEYVKELHAARQRANVIQQNIQTQGSAYRPSTRHSQLRENAQKKRDKLVQTRQRKIAMLTSEYTRTLRLYEETLRRALWAEERKRRFSPRHSLYSANASLMSSQFGGHGTSRGAVSPLHSTRGAVATEAGADVDHFPEVGGPTVALRPDREVAGAVSGIGKLGVDPRGQGMYFIKFSDENLMLCGWMRIIMVASALRQFRDVRQWRQRQDRERIERMLANQNLHKYVWLPLQIKFKVRQRRKAALVIAQALAAWRGWRILWFASHYARTVEKIQRWWRECSAWHEKEQRKVVKVFLQWERRYLAEKIRQQEYRARAAAEKGDRGGPDGGKKSKSDKIAEAMARAEAKARANMTMDEKTQALLMLPREREEFVRQDLYTRRFLSVHGEGRVLIRDYLVKRQEYFADRRALSFLGQKTKGARLPPIRPWLPSYLPRNSQIAQLVQKSMKELAEQRKSINKRPASQEAAPPATGSNNTAKADPADQAGSGTTDPNDGAEQGAAASSRPSSAQRNRRRSPGGRPKALSGEELSSVTKILDGGLRMFGEFNLCKDEFAFKKEELDEQKVSEQKALYLKFAHPSSVERDLHRLKDTVKDAAGVLGVTVGKRDEGKVLSPEDMLYRSFQAMT